jgi:hypothetical protein
VIKRLRILFPVAFAIALILSFVFSSLVSAALPSIRVGASVKDSYGLAAAFNNANTTIGSGKIGASSLNGAMIFDDISIPAGSKIYSAKITLTANATRSTQAINSRIYAEDAAAPADYGAAEDFTARTYTTAYVDFDGSKSWTLNLTYDLTDMTAVVQELVDSYAPYVSGSMAFMWKDDTSTADKRLEAYSYDGNSTKAPLLVIYYSPPDAYWINGSGTWTNTGSSGHWSLTTGGASDPAITPGTTTNVHFDSNSFSGGDQTVSLGDDTYCHDMDWTGSLAGSIFGNQGTETNNIYCSGSLTVPAGMTWTAGTWGGHLTMNSTGAETVDTNGVVISNDSYMGIEFDGAGGEWTLLSTLNTNITGGSTYGNCTLTKGTLLTNGQTVSCNNFILTGTDLRSLNLGSSVINVGNTTSGDNRFDAETTTLLTFNAGTSIINLINRTNEFKGGGLTYNNVVFNSANIGDSITGANTFNNLTIYGYDKTDKLTLFANQTITGTFTAIGSSSAPISIYADTFGTPRTITAANVSVSHTNFRDITGAGAGDWDLSGDFSGDCGGNSGITFTTPAYIYAVDIGGMLNFSNSSIWANASNGVGGSGRVPLPQDTAVFDSHSVIIPGCTLTLDLLATSGIDSSLVTNTPIFSATDAYFYNSLDIGPVTWSVTNAYMYGRHTQTLTSSVALTNLYIRALNYSVTLGSDLVCSGTIYHEAGVLNTGLYDLQTAVFNSYTTTTYPRTIVLNSSYVVLTSTAATQKWNVSATNLTLQSMTSVIYFTNSGANTSTFRGAGLTYYDLYIDGAGDYATAFSDANTFHTIYVDRSLANKTISGNYNLTISHFELPVSGARTITITNTDFTMASGVVLGDYLIISGSAAGGGATFYANVGGHSTNNGGNSGWIWTGTTLPTMQTNNASDITSMGARMNGELLTVGSYLTFTCYFKYGPTAAYGLDTLADADTLTAAGLFDYFISPYHAYHYQAVVKYGSDYLYGSDKTISLSGAVTQAKAAVTDPGQSSGVALMTTAPPAIPRMYVEGNTQGLLGLGPLVDPALAETNTPIAAFWYPIAFLIAIIAGFIAFGLTRELIVQSLVSAFVMAAFCGGGVLGDGLLPYLTVVIFIIEAGCVWLIQQKQHT